MYVYHTFHELMFKVPAGTSRGTLLSKPSWYIIAEDKDSGRRAIGECSIIPDLSPDKISQISANLDLICKCLNTDVDIPETILRNNPAIGFAIEMLLKDLALPEEFILFENDFIRGKGIPINGLVWMGEKSFILHQIRQKIESGYSCIKLKIASLNFQEELDILKYIRKEFHNKDLEIRLDANGGFEVSEALEKLKRLYDFDIHSIEQPISKDQWEAMARLCIDSPIDIALDEELIGRSGFNTKSKIISTISPQYIILKPSLLGGFNQCHEWIDVAESLDVAWWVTSALESNIGLNAIAQWTYGLNNSMYQGLGTGRLFNNNIDSPLFIEKGLLYYGNQLWETNNILKND